MENNLGKRIKAIRKQLDKNQADFSKTLDIAYPTLSKYENGHREPELATLIKIAKLGNVSLDWLLTGEGLKHRGGEYPREEILPGQVAASQAEYDDPMEGALIKMFRGLLPGGKVALISNAGELLTKEVSAEKKLSKKAGAAP